MDAPRDFLIFYFLIFYFFSERAARGGGGGGGGVRCQTFSFSFFPCSADHERDWPPCKVVFFGLATNALNVRNNNNNNNIARVRQGSTAGKVANPARGQLNREKYCFPVPVRA